MPGSGLAVGTGSAPLWALSPLHLKRVKGVASTAWSQTEAPMCLCEHRRAHLECTGLGATCPDGCSHLALPTMGMIPSWEYNFPEQERDSVGLHHQA